MHVDSTCSTRSATLDEPLAGTAAIARSWLCLEQRGPWGHNAPLDSHLDSALGTELATRTEASGVRLQLLRRPHKHADRPEQRSRRVLIAHTNPAGSWLRATTITDPAELLDLDLDQLAAGVPCDWGSEVVDPVLLVCTNGRRDRCCALHGRALATELAARHGNGVWETNHTGGHRFAPAAVLLPSGYTYGRLTSQDADAALSAAAEGQVSPHGCRGRSSWSHRGQAAELAVRERIGEYAIDALQVTDSADANPGELTVRHRDGRTWLVDLREHALEPPRANSCGKTPVRPVSIVVDRVRSDD